MSGACYAVLTGDIVASSRLPGEALAAIMTALAQLPARVTGWPGEAGVRYERFRGDGWQLLLAQPGHALRASLFARAALRAACGDGETRISVGLGAAELGASLAQSAGPAFERSGRGLESLGVHQLWQFAAPDGDRAEARLGAALFAVCDERSRHWTARQAEIFLQLAVPDAPPMAAVAQALGVQAQTVQRHFDRAGGHALCSAVREFEVVWMHSDE